MTFDPVMTSAFVFFVVGLVLYFWTTTKAGERHQQGTLIVVWLLFALFASFLLFRFFPADQASGQREDRRKKGILHGCMLFLTNVHKKGQECCGSQAAAKRLEHRCAIETVPSKA